MKTGEGRNGIWQTAARRARARRGGSSGARAGAGAALFSAIPEGARAPPSSDARSAYAVDSEMVALDAAALRAGSVSATMLGDTYTISRDPIETRVTLIENFAS